MSEEKFKWISVTEYVDIDTGEQLAQLQIGTTHYRVKLLESKVTTNKRDYERTIKRLYGCRRHSAIQQKIWY